MPSDGRSRSRDARDANAASSSGGPAGNAGAGADDPLELLRAELTRHVDTTIHRAMSEFVTKTLTSTLDYHKRAEQKNEARFTEVELQLQAQRHAQDALQRKQEEQAALIANLQASLATMETVIPIRDGLDDSEFNRIQPPC